MHLRNLPPKTVLAALVCALAAHTAWADMASDMNSTLGALSTDTSAAATTSNVTLLQNKVDALKVQIAANQSALKGLYSGSDSYAALQSQITQQQAAVGALQGIISRLQQGYTMTSYETSTDASTLVTSVMIGFSKTTGSGSTASTSTATLTTEIPPTVTGNGDPVTEEGSSSGSNSSGYDSADMFTQMLQQLAMQQAASALLPQMSGMMNPFANIQAPLTNLVNGNGGTAAVQATNQKAAECPPGTGQGDGVAVYDIAAGKVYMPDGTVLDAHSGMGSMMDNPDYVNQPNSGPTPPNTYNLSMRESLYHGVEAIRLTPTDSSSMYGRNGILAHTKLVRGNNGSHGCVAFADYAQFLAAFKSGQVKQLVVVPRGAKPKTPKTCTPPAYNTPAGTPAAPTT